jgi:hypothetical protein
VHTELPRRPALVALVFLEHGGDKSFLEFPDGLGVENVAPVHLLHKRFKLIFHGISLSGVWRPE